MRSFTITAVLSADHRRADELFEAAMQAAEAADWSACHRQMSAFVDALKQHMKVEEDALFPAFEQASGTSNGPTAVMRHEHRQMLALLDRISEAVTGRDALTLRTTAESFVRLMAAHSAKEENALYPMCDKLLPDAGDETLRQLLSELERALPRE